MASSENSPLKVESLEVQIIVHSVKINSHHHKYQVEATCNEKHNKEQTNKMKKDTNSDVIFFESTFYFHLKTFDAKTKIDFKVFEFINKLPTLNGKATLKYEEFFQNNIEFLDLPLKKCTDPSGIICISVSSLKKMIPSISITENTADESTYENNLNNNDSEDEKEEENKVNEEENEEKIEGPSTSLKESVANCKSQARSLEQSEIQADVGNENKKCKCVCIVF